MRSFSTRRCQDRGEAGDAIVRGDGRTGVDPAGAHYGAERAGVTSLRRAGPDAVEALHRVSAVAASSRRARLASRQRRAERNDPVRIVSPIGREVAARHGAIAPPIRHVRTGPSQLLGRGRRLDRVREDDPAARVRHRRDARRLPSRSARPPRQ
jgi:hypothetical protein